MHFQSAQPKEPQKIPLSFLPRLRSSGHFSQVGASLLLGRLQPRQPRFDSWRGHLIKCHRSRNGQSGERLGVLSGRGTAPSHLRRVKVSSMLMQQDTLSEWLRRWTRNPLGSARKGSNPLGVALPFVLRLLFLRVVRKFAQGFAVQL